MKNLKENITNPTPISERNSHHFVGFHDICPWSSDGSYATYLETNLIERMPNGNEEASIILKNLKTGVEEEISRTRAWNFHQGARLQWVPRNNNKIVFNDLRNGKFVSVIYDIEEKKEKEFSIPIYAVHPSGDFGLGVNFSRLREYGGYGYKGGVSFSDVKQAFPKDDGIFKINFKTGEAKLILSIYEIAHFENEPKENEMHFPTHLLFNKSGSRFCFVHKWKMKDGGFWNRFLTVSSDGKDLFSLPGHISHFDWLDNERIIGFGRNRTNLMKLRKTGLFSNPIFKPLLFISRKLRGKTRQKLIGDRYLLFYDKTKKTDSIGTDILVDDGHPSISPDKKWMITDTYPSKDFHKRKLILFNLEKNEGFLLGEYNSLPNNGFSKDWDLSEMRADLHPRWNREGTQVCFDSVHEGKRQVYILDVKDTINR